MLFQTSAAIRLLSNSANLQLIENPWRTTIIDCDHLQAPLATIRGYCTKQNGMLLAGQLSLKTYNSARKSRPLAPRHSAQSNQTSKTEIPVQLLNVSAGIDDFAVCKLWWRILYARLFIGHLFRNGLLHRLHDSCFRSGRHPKCGIAVCRTFKSGLELAGRCRWGFR